MPHTVIRKNLSIRFQILSVCLFSLLIMQVLLLINYYQIKEMKISNNSSYFSDLIGQLSDSVVLNCTYLNGMVENIAYSKVVQEYLESDDKSYIQSRYTDIKNFISPYANINYGIKDIAVIGIHDNYVNLNADINDLQKIVPEIPEKELWYYSGLNSIRMASNIKNEYLSVGANVYSISDLTRKEKIGTVIITFNMNSIFGFSQNQKNTKLPDMLIYDRNNQLIYTDVEEGVNTSYSQYFDEDGNGIAASIKENAMTFYIKTGHLEYLNGKVVFLIPEEELMEGLDSVRQSTLIIFLVIFLCMFTLSFMVTKNIVIPIKQFMDYLIKVGRGDLRIMKQPVQLKGASEIIIMSEEFNRMMSEITDLNHRLINTSARLYESELAKKQSELEYLHSQINPHFLFNTLETIKGRALEEEAGNTFQMINSLGKMFRYCVRYGNVVSLHEEINIINSYMLLQKNRFGTKLNYICHIEENICEAAIPKMILQPLIENAVIHGIEEKGAVTVWLEGEMNHGILCFHVRDDGEGVDEESRMELVRMMEDKSTTNHIGISNVHKRIQYIYGDDYGIDIEATNGNGFCISIKFPYEKVK